MAEKNEYINAAVETIYKVTSDTTIREQCRAREDYYRLQRTNERERERITKELEDNRLKLEEMNNKFQVQSEKLQEQEKEIAKLHKILEEQNR